MTEQLMEKIDYSPLGFWRHFVLVRFLYARIQQLEVEKLALIEEIRTREVPRLLTPDIKESNNIAVPVISQPDEDDDTFYQRRPNEKVEDFLARIGTTQPKQAEAKTVKSANDLVEEARRAHIKSFADLEDEKEKSKNIIVSDSAVDRIGKSIAAQG